MSKSPLTYVSPIDPPLKRTVMNVLELATGRKMLSSRYAKLQAMELEDWQVWGKSLELLEVGVNVKGFPLKSIPKDGPLVFIANHPFGVVDGLIMGKIAAETRGRFSILVNAVLGGQDPRIEANLLPIDFAETKEAAMVNIATRQQAINKLKQGEAIVIFPSGGVATAHKVFGKAEELDWKRFTAQLIQKSGATVVPIYFHGQNSPLFHLASKVGPTFRLGLLLREVRNKMGKTIQLTVGEPIHFEKLSQTARQEMMELLKEITFGLQHQ
ncbi:MAG: lysophospholipid acyltransferase family protein [Bacteroidia bacterium]|nr:lysophospholipid acyltransferase family protein [Bacteroidia bacterium]